MAEAKLPFYFSVDFEDFEHDYLRELGHPAPPMNIDALWQSYARVNELSDRYFGNRRVTFFVTGVLARAAPDLVKQIADDGHEVACHYNFHDPITDRPRDELGPNLDIAIEALAAASGQTPVGFRAPDFAIAPTDDWAFAQLSKRFAYDSSYRTSAARDKIAPGGLMIFGERQLREFFVYGHPHFGGRVTVRTGGTFLRLFPVSVTLAAMHGSVANGHTALIYVHPYELLTESQFWVPWEKFAATPSGRRLDWARQVQWIKAGHKSFERKLAAICDQFEHQGPMAQALGTTP